MKTTLPPTSCQTMAELRCQIDTIDAELIDLLATRSRYIDRAVDLKRIEGLPARTTDRVKQILDKVSATAAEKGLDPTLVRTIWTELIEWSIHREIRALNE